MSYDWGKAPDTSKPTFKKTVMEHGPWVFPLLYVVTGFIIAGWIANHPTIRDCEIGGKPEKCIVFYGEPLWGAVWPLWALWNISITITK